MARLDQKVDDMDRNLNQRMDGFRTDFDGLRDDFHDFRDELRTRDQRRMEEENARESRRIARAEELAREDQRERRKIRYTFLTTVGVAVVGLITAVLTQGIHI
jgi:tRNA A37 N6-isopentenylltransferase MiaA